VPRALVVPDEESALVWGARDRRYVPVVDATRAHVLVVPERVPGELVAAVRAAWAGLPSDRRVHTYAYPAAGQDASEVLDGNDEHGDHDDSEAHGEHEGHDGGHDHGDMMAITGEPSADGLVMEELEVEAGPLGLALAGGLVVSATLDGDVVAGCRLRPTLAAADASAPPDPWSAIAWNVAELAARERRSGVTPREERWLHVAGVEIERAVSHLAWLHRLCRLLGWSAMTTRVRGILEPLTALRGALPVQLTTPDLPDLPVTAVRDRLRDVQAATRALADALAGSRSFGRRTGGLGTLTPDEVTARGVAGPIARASGIADDARAGDPGYARLGFEPVTRADGDARARALLRAAEAGQAAGLTAAAVEQIKDPAEPPAFGDGAVGVVESARGPVRVRVPAGGEPERTAVGARAARAAAAELAVGREWAAALLTIASFDVSPWRVGP
jgi:Ni,Fe-hydrogenase III large subunit